MPRIKLAYWHDGHGPGDEIEVTADVLAALTHDGRVAEVLAYSDGGVLEATPVEAVNDSGQAETVEPAPASGRKRR